MTSAHEITPSQRAFNDAARERARKRAEAAKLLRRGKTEGRIVMLLPEPVKPTLDLHVFRTRASFMLKRRDEYGPYAGGSFGGQNEARRTMNQIASDVLRGCPGITLAQIKGISRVKKVIWPRHHIVYAIRTERPDISFPQIGRWMGGRDHTTSLNSYRAWERHLAEMEMDDGD